MEMSMGGRVPFLVTKGCSMACSTVRRSSGRNLYTIIEQEHNIREDASQSPQNHHQDQGAKDGGNEGGKIR